jgi:hypothetical protein
MSHKVLSTAAQTARYVDLHTIKRLLQHSPCKACSSASEEIPALYGI